MSLINKPSSFLGLPFPFLSIVGCFKIPLGCGFSNSSLRYQFTPVNKKRNILIFIHISELCVAYMVQPAETPEELHQRIQDLQSQLQSKDSELDALHQNTVPDTDSKQNKKGINLALKKKLDEAKHTKPDHESSSEDNEGNTGDGNTGGNGDTGDAGSNPKPKDKKKKKHKHESSEDSSSSSSSSSSEDDTNSANESKEKRLLKVFAKMVLNRKRRK